MNIIAGHSLEKNIDAAVRDLKTQFEACDCKMVIFFASSIYNPHKLGKAMQEGFPDARVFGCSTAGEIVSGKMLKNSIVAMALNAEVIEDIKIEVLEEISDACDVAATLASFEQYYSQTMMEMDFDKYLGIILIDGLRGAEEKVMDKIGDLSNIRFAGGSAGDDFRHERTFVFANGKACSDAAVVALLKLPKGFDIIKTQSFRPLNKHLTVSKSDTENREVIEFNNKPAALAYAEALGTSPEEAEKRFMRNPIGLMVDGEPYVRSPRRILADARMKFYCNMVEGMELTLLESTDIVADTKKAVADKEKTFGRISGILNFHCILRTLELEDKAQTTAYGRIFSDIPTAGFSTYGEIYVGYMNQTSTMILFH